MSFKSCTFNGESDSSGITDSCSGCGRPHNAHPTAKTNKTLSSVKNILSKRFSMYHFTDINDMFIVSGKSHCCNDTFTDVRFTSLLAKNI